MRTTLDIDDQVLQKVRQFAKRTGMTLGETAGKLLQAALQQTSEPPVRYQGKVSVIQTPAGAEPPNLLEVVREWKEKG